MTSFPFSNCIPVPSDIIIALDRIAVGQQLWKETLATEAFFHCYRYRMHTHCTDHLYGDIGPKQNILGVGPTGCGKTLLAKQAFAVVDMPFVTIDATLITSSAIGGFTVNGIVSEALKAAQDDIESAQWAVIFLDEIDKLAGRPEVQQELLKFIEGTQVRVRIRNSERVFDTSNMLFVGAGAFCGLGADGFHNNGYSEADSDVLKAHPFGQGRYSSESSKANESVDSIDNLAKFGIMPEFIGRFKTFVRLDALSSAMLRHILDEPYSPIAHLKNYCRSFGVELTVTDEALWEIASNAESLSLGARGLERILDRFRRRLLFDLPAHALSGYNKVIINGRSFREVGIEWDKNEQTQAPAIAQVAADLPSSRQRNYERKQRLSGARLANLDDIADLISDYKPLGILPEVRSEAMLDQLREANKHEQPMRVHRHKPATAAKSQKRQNQKQQKAFEQQHEAQSSALGTNNDQCGK